MVKVVAAIDDNHHGDTRNAHRLIDTATDLGCHAVRFRVGTVGLSAQEVLLDRPYSLSPGTATTRREIGSKVRLTLADHVELKRHAEENGLEHLIAPCDLPALAEVADLVEEFIYVTGAMAAHLSFLEAISGHTDRVYVCVGGCTNRELDRLLDCLDTTDLVLIHSNGNPSTGDLTHLRGIVWLRQFSSTVGYADTHRGSELAIGAALCGADIIEKGLILGPNEVLGDGAGSLPPAEFRVMMRDIDDSTFTSRNALWQQAIGRHIDAADFRPSLVASRRIAKGSVISAEMVTFKPPERGLSPSMLPWLLGRRAIYDIEEDDFITFGLVDLS